MNDQTALLLKQLADKLGTTTEYLWAALLKQAPITCTVQLTILLLMFIAGALLLIPTYKCYKDDDEAWYGFSAFSMCLLLASLLSFAVAGGTILSGFYNPEYWALQQVLSSLWGN